MQARTNTDFYVTQRRHGGAATTVQPARTGKRRLRRATTRTPRDSRGRGIVEGAGNVLGDLPRHARPAGCAEPINEVHHHAAVARAPMPHLVVGAWVHDRRGRGHVVGSACA